MEENNSQNTSQSDQKLISELRNEIDSLNDILGESAIALRSLSEKYQDECSLTRTLNGELDLTVLKLSEIATENESLKQELCDLRRELSVKNADILNDCVNTVSTENLVRLKSAELELTSLVRAHAEELCDNIVEAETDIMTLLSKFPGVDFEMKEPEIDPYQSTKGWSGRSVATGSSPGYLFGSPSERFPVSDRNSLSEVDEDRSGSENESENGNESRSDEEKSVNSELEES